MTPSIADVTYPKRPSHLWRLVFVNLLGVVIGVLLVVFAEEVSHGGPFAAPLNVLIGGAATVQGTMLLCRLIVQLVGGAPAVRVTESGITDYTETTQSWRNRSASVDWDAIAEVHRKERWAGDLLVVTKSDGSRIRIHLDFLHDADAYELERTAASRVASRVPRG